MGKRAEAGIGTLILFIAMILVAAIAAAVLVQTVSSLQSKAMTTGSKAKSSVATGLMMMGVEGSTSSASIDQFYVTFRLSPGSDSLDLNDTLVTISLHNNSQEYSLNQTMIGSCDAGLNDADKMNAFYVFNGTNHRDGYLQAGDVVQLCFEPPQLVGEGLPVRMNIQPKTGNPVTLDMSTPDIIVKNREYLFP